MSKIHIIAEVATNYFDSLYLAEQSIKKLPKQEQIQLKFKL